MPPVSTIVGRQGYEFASVAALRCISRSYNGKHMYHPSTTSEYAILCACLMKVNDDGCHASCNMSKLRRCDALELLSHFLPTRADCIACREVRNYRASCAHQLMCARVQSRCSYTCCDLPDMPRTPGSSRDACPMVSIVGRSTFKARLLMLQSVLITVLLASMLR